MRRKNQTGQSLIEVVVAVSVSSLIIVALVAGIVAALRNAQVARNRTTAAELNRQAMEWLRAEKNASWSEFANHTGAYCFDMSPENLAFTNPGPCEPGAEPVEATDKFFRQASLTAIGGEGDKIEITMTTTWQDHVGEHNETLETYLTKW